MPRKRPPVVSDPDKPHVINDDKISLFRKITPKMLMNQYVQIPKPPKPIEYIEETTTVNELNKALANIPKPTFSERLDASGYEDIRNKAKSLLAEPVVSQSLLQERFANKKFPNGMKAMCYSCKKDIYFMDDFFIHAGTVHSSMLYETVETFLKLIDKIEKGEKGSI